MASEAAEVSLEDVLQPNMLRVSSLAKINDYGRFVCSLNGN